MASNTREERGLGTFRLLAALTLALIAVSAVEAGVAIVSSDLRAAAAPRAISLAMWSAWKYLLAPICFALATAAIELPPERRFWTPRVRGAVQIALVVAIVGALYMIFVDYEPFRGYLPFVAAFALGAIGLAAWLLLRRRAPRTWCIAASAALLLCGAAAHVANYRVYLGLYPTLHLTVIQAELLAVVFGVEGLLRGLAPERATRTVCAAALCVSLLAGAAGAYCAGAMDDTEASFIDTTVLGQSVTVFSDFSEGGAKGKLDDPAGAWRFQKLSGMPALPASFALEDYNILLIASEATRFDKTTMADPKTPSTPNLARRARSALLFRRAYAPSSGTLHSTAGVLAMAYPSMIAMETWMKVWTGQLYDEEETVAESLASAGYDTFWVGYNHWFPTSLRGFEQGFASVERISGNDDALIADRAVAALEKRARGQRPFFGFCFFVSPHAPYLDHGYADLPKKRDKDRYLQELRFVDAQLERIFETLERTGAAQKTIVVYISDHGEEFKEHRGTHHKTTVYDESTHVPFVAWIPGLRPSVIERPVSTSYLFPWLFSKARTPHLRERYVQRADHVFGPMLKATGGAVVVELIGSKRMKTALVYDELKIDMDLISKRIEIYDTRKDPREKRNLYTKAPELNARAKGLAEAYKRVRQTGARYVLKPKKVVQSDADD
jgi:arylsulfatase A-like enzyme